MRLFVLAVPLLILAQPAMAREHFHHHSGFHHGHHYGWSRGHHYGWSRGHHYGWRHHWRRGELPSSDVYASAEPIAPGFGERRDAMFDPMTPAFVPAPRIAVAPAMITPRATAGGSSALDALIARHAQLNGVPESLVRRVVVRESRYNPRAIGRGGAMGLMQIKTATARAMGYSGSSSGLLNAETNLTYAVRYLAGAYRAAGGNANRAVGYYARGYYGAAKRRGIAPYAAPVAETAASYEVASADRPLMVRHRYR